jgi:hypothetical protein
LGLPVGLAAARCSVVGTDCLAAAEGTDDADNARQGTDNAIKATDNAIKATDNVLGLLIMRFRALIMLPRVPMIRTLFTTIRSASSTIPFFSPCQAPQHPTRCTAQRHYPNLIGTQTHLQLVAAGGRKQQH